MSRTLGRLRRATGDDLLVRTGRRMALTPRAEQMRAEVHAVVLRAQAVLAADRELDLATLDRTFALACHDAVTTAVGGALLTAVTRAAPGVTLRLLAEGSGDSDDLRLGRVDLEISSVPTIAIALGLLPDTDLVVVAVPGTVARESVHRTGLRTVELPVELSPVSMTMSWHHRHDTDQAHAWLRDTVRDVLRTALSDDQPWSSRSD